MDLSRRQFPSWLYNNIETSMLGIFVRFPCTTSHRKKQVNGKKSSYTNPPFSLLFAFDGNSTGEMRAGGKEKFREMLMMAHTSKGRRRKKYTIARQPPQRLKHFDWYTLRRERERKQKPMNMRRPILSTQPGKDDCKRRHFFTFKWVKSRRRKTFTVT